MDGAELATLITSLYIQYYRNQGRSYAAKSALDISHVPSLHARLSELASLIEEGIGSERTALQYAELNAQGFFVSKTVAGLSGFLHARGEMDRFDGSAHVAMRPASGYFGREPVLDQILGFIQGNPHPTPQHPL